MGTKTNKEKDIDSDHPSTIRIIAGSLVLLCIFPIFGICVYGMYYLLELYPARKFSIFEHFWGKLLIIFISGIIFLISIGILVSLVLVAVKIWMGKSRMMKHVIYPFPTVLTAELADAMKVERADDEFFIFNRHSLIRGTLIVTGGILSCVGIITIGVEMNDPFSEVYWPPYSGGILASFLLLLNGLITSSRRFVLDRMNGTVTFSRHLFFPSCTIPFSKVVPGYSNGNLCFAHPRSGIVIPVLGAYDSGWWSFYVLYMDKNRPLPQGEVFDPYREKDFLRRKAAGFPKPIYPNTILVTDAYMGYIYGTDEFKQRLSKIKHRIVHYHDRVLWYCQEHGIEIPNDNDLVLIGLWKKQFVFKLFAPENVEYIVIPDDAVLTDCFLCDSETDEVKYIK